MTKNCTLFTTTMPSGKINFLPGTHVKVISKTVDFYFFYGETGTVISNNGEYLGCIVKFDVPREFEDGYIQETFDFNEKDLEKIQMEVE